MASTVASILSGGALTGVSKIIDSIRGKSPEDAAKLAQINADLQALQVKYAGDFALAKINENVQLNETAGQNIRAEAAGGWYAASARPSVIYAGLVVIILNYALLAVVPRAWGWHPVDVPAIVWEIWCVCVTGYVFARTGDKLFGGAGGSLQLPFIKADSKGDLPQGGK